MTGNKLFLQLLWRFILLILTCLAVGLVAFRMLNREMVFTLIAGLVLVGVQVWFLSQYILRIHRIMVTFVDSVGSGVATELRFRESHPYMSELEARLNDLKAAVSLSRFEERKQRALLNMVVDSMDPALICIDREKEVIFTNKPARALLQNAPVSGLEDIRKLNPGLARAMGTSGKCADRIASLPGFKASVRCSPFVLGKEEYVLYSVQDIQQEVEAQETESWQKLIRVLTHEIMNSLGPVLSLSKSLQKSTGNPDKLLEGLNTIENTGEGLIHFIKEYRKLSTLPPPEKEEILLPELFVQIASLFSEEIRGMDVGFHLDTGEQELTVHADRHQLEQVLVNLVRNALDSLEGSKDGKVVLESSLENGMVVIRVEDNGPGIPAELLDQVFIPFYSTKKGGSGIGLSLSRQIMHNHGGTLGCSSIPGGPTVFTLRFR